MYVGLQEEPVLQPLTVTMKILLVHECISMDLRWVEKFFNTVFVVYKFRLCLAEGEFLKFLFGCIC